MPVTGFCHAAIGVRDADRSIAFYRDVLGLTVTLDAEERGERTPFHRRAVYLRWEEGARPGFVVLDQQLDKPAGGEPAAMFDISIHHIGFAVDDVAKMMDRAKAAGFEVFSTLTPYSGAAFGVAGDETRRVITGIVRDPDGHIIQLDQWLDV